MINLGLQAYATTDIPVQASYGLASYLRGAGLDARIAATVSTSMGMDRGGLWGVRSTEMFVVKYAVNCDPDKVNLIWPGQPLSRNRPTRPNTQGTMSSVHVPIRLWYLWGLPPPPLL